MKWLYKNFEGNNFLTNVRIYFEEFTIIVPNEQKFIISCDIIM